MSLNQQELKEFKAESLELLEVAEKCLLALEQGAELNLHFDSIFRTFHNLKGAAGMMELMELQSHMHQLENILMRSKGATTIPKSHIDLFLRGIDATKEILEGNPVEFCFDTGEQPTKLEPGPQKALAPTPIVQPINLDLLNAPPQFLVLSDVTEAGDRIITVLRSAGRTASHFDLKQFTPAILTETQPQVVLAVTDHFNESWKQHLRLIIEASPDTPIIYYQKTDSEKPSITSLADLYIPYRIVDSTCSNETLLEVCIGATEVHRLKRLVSRSLHLLMYQYSDLVDFLRSTGKTEVQKHLQLKVHQLVEECRMCQLDQVKLSSPIDARKTGT